MIAVTYWAWNCPRQNIFENRGACGYACLRNFGKQNKICTAWGELVCYTVGALSPVNHKGLYQGWTQTSLYLQVIHFISHHTTSHAFFFLAYLYSTGTQPGNLHPAGWPILFCGPTHEPCVSHSQHRRNRERFWKKCEWMDWKGRNKQGWNPWQ